jgi:hypothetical protein
MRVLRTTTTGIRRPSTRPASTWLLAALLLTATLAACDKGGGNGSNTNSAAVDAGRQYAQCLRDNGVPDFPDPDPDGGFSGLSHEKANDPKFQAAVEKCRALAPGGQHENFGDPIFVAQVRAYSQCMRDNGVPNFPDPDPDGRLRGQGHEQQDDPKFQAAQEKCQAKLPGGGSHQ